MTIRTHRVAGLHALSELARFQKQAASRGERAFLIGDSSELRRIDEHLRSRAPDVPKSIQLATSLDVDTWLSDRRKEMEEDGCEFDESLVGRWPGELHNKGSISLHLDPSTQNSKREVFVAIAPVSESWQIPSAIGYGGWNACPDSVVQCALAKRWAETYDADIIGLCFDTI